MSRECKWDHTQARLIPKFLVRVERWLLPTHSGPRPGSSPLPYSFGAPWWGLTGNHQDPMVGLWTGARYSSPSVSLFGLWLSYADTPGPMKHHCWRENFAFGQSGIISRRKPAQWMLAATVNVGLATSCLGPLGPGLCFLPWIFQALTRRCSIPWRTWGILSARLSPCWPALSLAWFQGFPAGTRRCFPWCPLPFPAVSTQTRLLVPGGLMTLWRWQTSRRVKSCSYLIYKQK